MADVTGATVSFIPAAILTRAQEQETTPERPDHELIELFFFAYRDFVADPDLILADIGLGRAHHRVLHFVDRRPGLTVAELLDILRITKQSLNRVLKTLIERGFIEQQQGVGDRRQRHLYATAAGHALTEQLAAVQTRRLRRALAGGVEEARAAARRFLLAMVEAESRAQIRSVQGGVVGRPDGV